MLFLSRDVGEPPDPEGTPAPGATTATVESPSPGGMRAPLPAARGDDPRSFPEASDLSEEDLAIAYGFLLDSPRPKEVVEEGLRIAELLRRRYAIDTGNPYQDRLVAARRAKREFVDRLEFSDEEVEEKAASLGHSLDPDECADFCPQVYRLAILELQKSALRAFAEGKEGPGRLAPDAPASEQNES
jgi:hypothetical protein